MRILPPNLFIIKRNFHHLLNIIQRHFFKQTVANSDAATTESFPLYEAFERVLQHNLDVQFPFYSEYLGRPECVYNLDGDTYATESQLRHFNVMSGLNVRGLALSNNDNPLAINFDKLYDSSSSILNLGMAIEVIDDFTRVRVEEYAHFCV